MSKEHPILFSGEMVRAILDGRKTQTRRVIKKITRESVPGPELVDCITDWDGGPSRLDMMTTGTDLCPYGRVGDLLWVRETWSPLDKDHWIERDRECAYKASTTGRGEEIRQEYIALGRNYKWRSPIHMPKWAARIWLEITGLRSERLQEITGEDAIQEGWPREKELFPNVNTESKALSWFGRLWDSLNAKRGYGWDTNPWVWVIEFKRIEKPKQ